MGYKKAEEILPSELIELIQEYVDGEHIYIPRKEEHRQKWGSNTKIRQELLERNLQIYEKYLEGKTILELAENYCLSPKSIERIIRNMKK